MSTTTPEPSAHASRPPSHDWPSKAMERSWPAFRDAAARYGYDDARASTMYAALPSLLVDPEVAATWMEAGFTTWSTRVWVEAGFALDAVAEAAEYQRWGLNAEDAFWVRKDGTSATTLRERRALVEVLTATR